MGKEFVGSIGPSNNSSQPPAPSPSVPKKTFLTNINGKDGAPGEDAYQIAVENGFEGSEAEWLESLDGIDGTDAYGIALLEGFIGTRAEWLDSIKGKSAYELAVISGYDGTLEAWLEDLRGPQGDSAYAIAQSEGFTGTKDEWVRSLKGEEGDSAYEIAQASGFPGTKEQWLDSLEGVDGEDGFSPYLSKTATHIQVQYFTYDGEPASDVLDLVALSEIAGKDGRDPYLIAVANGFVGTEAEWVDSLKGVNGTNGYTPELTVNDTHIQLRYTRDGNATDPVDLISIEEITGKDAVFPETQGSAQTVPYGQPAELETSIDPDTGLLLFSAKIPAGKDGISPAQPVPSVVVRDAEAGAPGSASITGTYPNWNFEFFLRRGQQGAQGVSGGVDTKLSGNGMPNGVATASVGAFYVDLDSTNGAQVWYKASGTGNTGWVVFKGDTKWRRINYLIVAGSDRNRSIPVASGGIDIRRVDSQVYTRSYRMALAREAAYPNDVAYILLPLGFYPDTNVFWQWSKWDNTGAFFLLWNGNSFFPTSGPQNPYPANVPAQLASTNDKWAALDSTTNLWPTGTLPPLVS